MKTRSQTMSYGKRQVQLEDFSDEVLLLILNFLDLKSKCRVACLNNRFKTLAYDPSLYIKLDLSEPPDYQKFWECSRTQTLLASRCRGLRRVNLADSWHYDKRTFKEFIENAGCHLTHLNADYSKNYDLPTNCSQLVDVSLACVELRPKAIAPLMQCHRLIRLDVRGSLLSMAQVTTVLRHNRSLKYLNISGWEKLVNLEYVTHILVEFNSSLESLTIHNIMDFITPQVINNIAGLRNLRELAIETVKEHDQKMSDSFFRLFTNCKQLRVLQIEHCNQVTAREIDALVTSCPSITELHLSGCSKLRTDYDFVHNILSNLKHLEHIGFGPTQMKKEEVDQLIQMYGKVRIDCY